MIAVALLHLLRVFFTGAGDGPRKLNRVIGLTLLACVLASNFTGYLLPWDQLSYWAVTICTGMLGYVPSDGALADEDPLVRYTAVNNASAVTGQGFVNLLAPLLFDPVRSVRIMAASRLADAPVEMLKPYQQEAQAAGLADYEEAMAYSLDFSFAGFNLGNLYARMGEAGMAEAYYRTAIDIDGLFIPARAGDFIRLARKLESLPVVKEQVAYGELGYTKVREIASVADPTNEKDWVKVAKEQSRRELEATVRQAKILALQKGRENPNQGELMPRPVPAIPQAIVPVRVGFELTPAQYAHYEAMLTKIGHHGSRADLLLDMVEALLVADEDAPRGALAEPHDQIHIHECPTCSKATVQTPVGEMELTKTEVEVAREDAQIHKTGERNKSTIPPRIRREVLARDRHCYSRKGCNHTRFLDIHHIIPRSKGGTNDPENLVTICTACHKLLHDKGGDPWSLLGPVVDKEGRLV